MAVHIYTKKKKDKWFCFGTFFGYDYSFEGLTIDLAQNQMRECLAKNKVVDAKWHEPEIVQSVKTEKYNGGLWRLRAKLDNL